MRKILITFCVAAFVFSGCENFLISTYDIDDSVADTDYVWSSDSHGEDADADYDLIFDDTVVHRIDITIPNSYYEEMEEEMEDIYGEFGSNGNTAISNETPTFVPVTISYEDNSWIYVGMRYKGNSSLSNAWVSGVHKLPFRLNFEAFKDLYPETDGQRFWGFEKLTFSNGYKDDSLIRDKMASDVFQMGGVPAAEAAFYRVYVDCGDGEGPVYWGLYTMIEDPSDAMLETQFDDGSGNLYKPDDEDESTLEYFDEEYYPKKINEDEDDWTDIETFIDTINDGSLSGDDWRTAMEAVFDVDGFLDYLAINNTIENWDVYGCKAHNYYLYADPSNDCIFSWFPWDMNEAFTDNNQSLSLSMSEVRSSWPLLYYIMDDNVYENQYEAKLYKYFKDSDSDDLYDVDELTALMSTYSALIEDYVIGDDNGEIDGYKWFDYDWEFTDGLTDLQEHIEDRFDDVDDYLIGKGW
ncbi:MAG: CotH kinase family protein [Spirochaetales bacterium]|uniref:CotH kinase family protein n=1 Tax=Candidatus Thalassospirochaeta sargassi TaxID=3119039 RepID=A0AAJ1IEA0_9SPIO|nr:CotH kinase family protein [Spirochaetales bacterium]